MKLQAMIKAREALKECGHSFIDIKDQDAAKMMGVAVVVEQVKEFFEGDLTALTKDVTYPDVLRLCSVFYTMGEKDKFKRMASELAEFLEQGGDAQEMVKFLREVL